MTVRLEMIAQHKVINSLTPEIEKYRRLLKVPGLSRSVMIHTDLGIALLQAGKTAEAVEELEHVRRLIGQQKNVPAYDLSRLRDLLAIAYFRLGEQENCVALHNTDMCYLPIPPSGVHVLERGSRAAIREFTAALQENPDDLGSRWLLNIAYMTLGEYPEKVPPPWLIPPQAFASDHDIGRFNDVAPQLGLDVFGLAGSCIFEDFDGDGYLDLMVSSFGLRDQLRYFRNNGDGTFTERTAEAGLLGQFGGFGLFQADYNNDGFPDVLVMRGAWLGSLGTGTGFPGNGNIPNSLLRNNGDGTFTDVTEEAGLLSFHPTQAAAWGDYDNDGWLDLFIGNESNINDKHPVELFHNNGDGTFSEVSARVGITTIGMIKSVAWGDYNNDGLLDLFISRLGQSNVLYRNEGTKFGKWSFTDVTVPAGVAEPQFNFATWFWDYDNDGWLDIFVAGYSSNLSTRANLEQVAALYLGLPIRDAAYPRLYRNNHDGTFTDVAHMAKLDRVLYVMGANFADLDNDGFLDLYLGTGAPDYRVLLPNRMFRNAGGKFFQDVTTSAGVGHLQKGHGVCFGDIDNDGNQDIFEEMGGWYPGDRFFAVLFKNPGHGNHWITLRLEGVQSNRSAIGARIKVRVQTEEGERDIYATVSSGGTFGASSLQQVIGLGQATAIRALEITWPATGKVQIFENIAMDQILKIQEGAPHPLPIRPQPPVLSDSARQNKLSEGIHHHSQ